MNSFFDQLQHQSPSPLQTVFHPLLEEKQIRCFVKRDDLLHPVLSGNKWRKLKYNLIEAKNQGFDTLLTFGGSYSNHIYALAGAASIVGMRSVGVIRGYAPTTLSPTLRFASERGMTLYFVSPEEYRHRHDSAWVEGIAAPHGHCYIVPEGGSNSLALKGVAELAHEIRAQTANAFDVVATACGTGGTMAGLLGALPAGKKVLGFPVLKDGEFLRRDILDLLETSTTRAMCDWTLLSEYHAGGYAKLTRELAVFLENFHRYTHIALDPVYTGKMMSGLFDLIRKDYFQRGTRVVAVHTGGLQGWSGMRDRVGRLLNDV